VNCKYSSFSFHDETVKNHKLNGLCIRKKWIKKAVNNLFIFTFSKDMQNGLHVHGHKTQLCSKMKLASARKFRYDFYFTCKLLNLTPRFLSSVVCTGIDFCFQLTSQIRLKRNQVR
jgi:hypothetical protein